MKLQEDYEVNQTAYKNLKDEINRRYPCGRFVAIAGGRIVADAATFKELDPLLVAAGLNPREVFVAQAGVDYLENGIILLGGL